MVRALYGGSFDPLHLGHLSVIELAVLAFDEVAVVVLANPGKGRGLFSRQDRADLARRSTAHLSGVSVHEYHGLVVDVARELEADVLLRSAHKEGRHERSMAAMNENMSGIRTSFVVPDPSTSWISSTMVRTMVSAGRPDELRALVPAPVLAALRGGSTPT